MKTIRQERGERILIPVILVIGFLSVMVAGQLALRFSPNWKLNTDMESRIDPNSAYLTRRPSGLIEPVDPSILTQPGWIDFLTPGVSIITGTPFPPMTSTPSPAPTTVSSATYTAVITSSPTNTFVFIPSTPSSTPKRKPTKTNAPPTAITETPAFTPSSTSTSSLFTSTPTASQTATATVTATPTSTSTSTTPPEIGTTPDGVVYILPSGGALTLDIAVIANGDTSYDLVYYERAAPGGTGIFLDWMIVQIGDGTNWYTIFYWGNDIADTNSNMDFNILSNPQTPPEPDQRTIPTSELYNSTGIAIDIDAIVPPGTYSYIRFTAPPGDSDNQTEIDAVEVLP